MYNLPLFFQEMNERGKKEGPEWGKVVTSCVGCFLFLLFENNKDNKDNCSGRHGGLPLHEALLDKKKVPIRLNRHFP